MPDAACSLRARQAVPHYTPAVLSRRTHLALGLLTLAHAGLLTSLAWARFSAVHQRTFDLALYARIAWGVARGDLWSPVLNTHALGSHLSFVLTPLGLLGRVFGTVPVLLFAQAASVALCVWPLARIGARRAGQRGVWLGAVAWLLYPNLGHVSAYEFHPGTLAVLPLCWAFDALDRAHFKQLCLCALAMLFCREDLAINTVMLGVAHFGLHRDRKAFALIGVSLAYLAISMRLVIAYAPPVGSMDLHFGAWGGSPLGVFRALWDEPERVLAHFRAPQRLWYLVRVLAPLSFFSLRAPWLLCVAAPTLLLNLISVFPTSQMQYSHYLTAAVPSIVVSGVVGLASTRATFVHGMAVVALGIGTVAFGGLPWSRDFPLSSFQVDAQTRAARRVLPLIPAGASVQAPDALLPHLAERPMLRRGPPPNAGTDYVVADVSHRTKFLHQESLLRTLEEPFVQRLLSREQYVLLAYAPPYALLQRGQAAREGAIFKRYVVKVLDDQGADRKLSDCLSLVSVELDTAAVTLRFRAHAACPVDLALRLGSTKTPTRVDLLCDGAISPGLFQTGDLVRSVHELDAGMRTSIARNGLWLGLLRTSGAPPEPGYPIAVRVTR